MNANFEANKQDAHVNYEKQRFSLSLFRFEALD